MSITHRPPETAPADVTAVLSWTATGRSTLDVPAGVGAVGATDGADLMFWLSTVPLTGTVLASHAVDWPAGPALMRLDEVCFPVGAIAHRHTHEGTGYRHLVEGALRIEAGDHTQTMQVGDSWFEPAQTPVRAVSEHKAGFTRFVRCMIVPVALEGQSTFRLANPADAALRRLQVTHRHFDHPVQVEAG